MLPSTSGAACGAACGPSGGTPPGLVVSPPPLSHALPFDTCDVCGEKATGLHYGVSSCNGCKSFFRRTLISQRTFTCNRGKRCFDKPIELRPNCRFCRFEKCVAAGMNPVAIQNYEELDSNDMVLSILDRRKRSSSSTCTATSSVSSPPLLFEDGMCALLERLTIVEDCKQQLRCSVFNPSPVGVNVESLIDTPSIIQLGKTLPPMPDWPVPQPPSIKLLEWLKDGSFVDEPRPANRKVWTFFDMFVSIEYVKTMPFYSQLDTSDKDALLRNVVLPITKLTQAFYSYIGRHKTLVTPDGIVMCNYRPVEPEYEQMMHFSMVTAINEIKMTREEFVLFKAIVACDPQSPRLSPSAIELLERERRLLGESLLKHVLRTGGTPSRFAEVVSLSSTLARHINTCREFHVLVKMHRSPRLEGRTILYDQCMS